MQITDKDIQMFRERAKTELQSNGAVGRLAWDAIVNALCNEVEELRKNVAPGNAAAMREALCEIQRMAHEGEGEHCLFRCQQWAANINNAAKAALTAPARNIDRFATEGEALKFYFDHVPDNGNLATGYAEWLFATKLIYGDAVAEGGAE